MSGGKSDHTFFQQQNGTEKRHRAELKQTRSHANRRTGRPSPPRSSSTQTIRFIHSKEGPSGEKKSIKHPSLQHEAQGGRSTRRRRKRSTFQFERSTHEFHARKANPQIGRKRCLEPCVQSQRKRSSIGRCGSHPQVDPTKVSRSQIERLLFVTVFSVGHGSSFQSCTAISSALPICPSGPLDNTITCSWHAMRIR